MEDKKTQLNRVSYKDLGIKCPCYGWVKTPVIEKTYRDEEGNVRWKKEYDPTYQK
jgi:hypothetical protein